MSTRSLSWSPSAYPVDLTPRPTATKRLLAYSNGYDVVAASSEEEARSVLRDSNVHAPEDVLDGDGWRILADTTLIEDDDGEYRTSLGDEIRKLGGTPGYLCGIDR